MDYAKQLKKEYISFMYPLNYEDKENEIFKNFIYTPNPGIETWLNGFAWIAFYLAIALMFGSIIFIIIEGIQ